MTTMMMPSKASKASSSSSREVVDDVKRRLYRLRTPTTTSSLRRRERRKNNNTAFFSVCWCVCEKRRTATTRRTTRHDDDDDDALLRRMRFLLVCDQRENVLLGKQSSSFSTSSRMVSTNYYDRSSRGGFRPEDFSSVDEEEDRGSGGDGSDERRRRRLSGERASTTTVATTRFVKLSMILDGSETKEIFGLAVPALGALLADPLMSLIDTMFVGRIGVNELTALGPNAAIFQVIFQLFSFLSITTTGMVARHHVKFNKGSDVAEYKIRRRVSISLFFSVAFGVISLIVLNCFAREILLLVEVFFLSLMICFKFLFIAVLPDFPTISPKKKIFILMYIFQL